MTAEWLLTQKPLEAAGDGKGQGQEASVLGGKVNIKLAGRCGKRYRNQEGYT